MKINKIFYGWYIVLVGMLIMMVTGGLPGILSAFLPQITESKGYTQTEVSLIVSALTLGSVVSALVVAKLIKSISARKVVLWFGMIEAVMIGALGIVDSLMLMYVCAFIGGGALLVAGSVTIPTIITRWFDAKRGLAIGLTVVGLGLGGAMVTPYVSVIMARSGYEVAFLHLGAIIMLCSVIAFLVIKESPETMGLKAYGHNKTDRYKVEEKNEENTKSTEAHSFTLQEAIKMPSFICLLLFCLFNVMIAFGVVIQFPSYLAYLEVDTITIGKILTLAGIMSATGKIVSGFIYDFLGINKTNILFFTLAGIVIIGLMNMPIGIIPYIAFAGIGFGFVNIANPLMVSSLYGTKHYSEIFAVVMMVFNIGSILASTLSGLIIDVYGYDILFTIAIVFVVISATFSVLSMTYGMKKQREVQEQEYSHVTTEI